MPHVAVTDDTLMVDLDDGRTQSVPLAWIPTLQNAEPEERASSKSHVIVA